MKSVDPDGALKMYMQAGEWDKCLELAKQEVGRHAILRILPSLMSLSSISSFFLFTHCLSLSSSLVHRVLVYWINMLHSMQQSSSKTMPHSQLLNYTQLTNLQLHHKTLTSTKDYVWKFLERTLKVLVLTPHMPA